MSLLISLAEAAWTSPSPPIAPPADSSPPSVVHSDRSSVGMQWRQGCPLSCFLGELHPPCTLPTQSLRCPGDLESSKPSLHAEETKAPRGQVAFSSQFTCQTGLMMTLSPGFSPSGSREGLSPSVIPSMISLVSFKKSLLPGKALRVQYYPDLAWKYRVL